jgi:hypothetical protein
VARCGTKTRHPVRKTDSPLTARAGVLESAYNGSMVELERLDCGGYCTPDERFLVVRNVTGCGPSRRWTITDTAKSTAPLIAVPTLRAAEEWIAEWGRG